MEHHYDQQIRRYLLQFIRIFADMKIEVTPGVFRRVPVKYGDMSRMVAHILRDNSMNTALTAPQMSVFIQSFEMAPERRQDTTFVRKTRVVEREYNANDDEYTTDTGNRYMVNTYMPVPYTLNVQLDIWTTNTTDKFQLLEQIMTVFNPSVQIQTNDNPLDWSSIFEVELTGITWSNRSVPAGADTVNDVASLTFKIPVWINPPAMVTRQRIVEQIVANVFDLKIDQGEIRGILDPLNTCFDHLKQFVIAPGDLAISVEATSDQWVSVVRVVDGTAWSAVFNLYGNVDANPSGGVMTLKTANNLDDNSGDVVGTMSMDGDDLLLTIDPDTLPAVNWTVDAVVDPVSLAPGIGLPVAAVGQTYVLVHEAGLMDGEESVVPQAAWGTINASSGAVVRWNGAVWEVLWDPETGFQPAYLLNLDDGGHYTFRNGEWTHTYLGDYTPGYWRMEV